MKRRNLCEHGSCHEAQSHANDHNIFFNAFQQNEDKISTVGGQQTLLTSTALDNTLSALLERMKELANNFEFGDGKNAFDEAYGYFSDIGSDRGRALELLLSGLIKVLEGVALFATDFAKGVVLTLFDLLEDVIRLVREALFAEWEIPVVSQLHELFTGKKLTVTRLAGDLLSLQARKFGVVGHEARATMPGAGDIQHVQVILVDDTVQMDIDEVQPRP